jgi:hypothetical protein
MIKIIKRNFVAVFLLIFTLVVVNSFISLNKNFYKTEIKNKIVFYEGKDNYENLMIREFMNVINLTESDLVSLISKLNISYFESDDKIKNQIGSNFFKKTDKEIIFFNTIFIYDKFDKKKYEQFILSQFKLNLFKTLSQLKIKKKDDLKSNIKNCLVGKAITQTQNPNKSYKEFAKKLDEVYDIIYFEYLTSRELIKLFDLTDFDSKKKKINFLDCVKDVTGHNDHIISLDNTIVSNDTKSYELYYLINFNDFQNKNFDIRLEFTNYKNDRLIYFLNLLIILTFISINFSIKTINNHLKKTS